MPRAYHYTHNESSQVKEIAYDLETKRLSIVFQNTSGFRYHYPDVSPELVAEVMFSKSVGSAVKTKIVLPWGKNFEKENLAEQTDTPHFGGA